MDSMFSILLNLILKAKNQKVSMANQERQFCKCITYCCEVPAGFSDGNYAHSSAPWQVTNHYQTLVFLPT